MRWAWVGLLELPIDAGGVRRELTLSLTFTHNLQHLPGVYGEGNDGEA